MTTLKGAIRTYGATVRRIERDQQKKARESAKRFKEQQKEIEIENAQQAVSDWENYVYTIKSLHQNCTEEIDWNEIRNTDKPIQPEIKATNEDFAKFRLNTFKPSFFDKLFGSTQKKIDRLKLNIEKAKENDIKENDVRYNQYLEELKNWEELREISIGIKNKQHESYVKALEYFDPFSDIGELGTQISFNFESDYIDIDLHVNSLEIIPNYELKQTSTGKLSKRDMPKTRFNELYQDYVCSSSLRIAREVFAYLPIQYARVNAMAKIINSKTGHLEEQPILSVIFLPKTIENINLETIDPSDSMSNFVHNMNFNKTRGFEVIQKVELKK